MGYKLIKLKCSRCGAEVLAVVGEEVLAEARNSPTGLTMVAVPHNGHVLVAYVDADGNERGTRTAALVEVLEAAR